MALKRSPSDNWNEFPDEDSKRCRIMDFDSDDGTDILPSMIINPTCQNCLNIKAYLDAKFKELTDFIQEQDKAIMDQLAACKSLTKLLLSKGADTVESISAIFPICSDKELYTLNRRICLDNRKLYVLAIKNIIRTGLIKNFNNVLTEEVVLEFNIDGSHGKKRLRDYENFYAVLKDAILSDGSVKDAEGAVRKAIHVTKKRHFKKVQLVGSKERENTLEIEDFAPFKTEIILC